MNGYVVTHFYRDIYLMFLYKKEYSSEVVEYLPYYRIPEETMLRYLNDVIAMKEALRETNDFDYKSLTTVKERTEWHLELRKRSGQ